MAKEFKYDVLADFGTIEEGSKFDIKVKVISWNGDKPKLDIRKWDKENNMGKGISISLDCIDSLINILKDVDSEYELPNDSINM